MIQIVKPKELYKLFNKVLTRFQLEKLGTEINGIMLMEDLGGRYDLDNSGIDNSGEGV
jgi:hypothetical protein